MKINIPSKLFNILSETDQTKVNSILQEFCDSSYIDDGTSFFPEYTSHGYVHINNTLWY